MAINKIVFVWDFLYNSADYPLTYHGHIANTFKELIRLSTGIEICELRTLKNNQGEIFSRGKFYQLSGYNEIEYKYFSYDINKISDSSIQYLNSFIDENTFVLGHELGLDLRKILDNLNINFLNTWDHSWKLFDDGFLMINTNNENMFNKLLKYKVPPERFYFYADYWKSYVEEKHELNYLGNLEDNSCLFVGQILKDKSIDKDGVFLNILHFKERMQELSMQYSKIYYIPHPALVSNQELEDYLEQTEYIQKLLNTSTYHLLMSDKIKKVVGISSSVLYEAQFFRKDVEYLYQPLFEIDGDYGLNTFISVFEDYYNPYFWSDVLGEIMPTNKNVENKIYFYNIDNKFRNIRHWYYGYGWFSEMERTRYLIKPNHFDEIAAFISWGKLTRKYLKYKILAFLTFGNLHEKIKQKRDFLEEKVNLIKDYQKKLQEEIKNEPINEPPKRKVNLLKEFKELMK